MRKTWKRIHSLLMALAMLAVLLPAQGLMIARAAAPKDWTGYTPISTKEDLNNIRNNLTGKYYLTQDIVFTEADFAAGGAFYNEGEGWQPVGSEENPFSGTFDGNGHAIAGLKVMISETGDVDVENIGLFGYMKNGTIRNLGMVNSDIVGLRYTGSIVGYAYGSTIDNCYNAGMVSGGGEPHDYPVVGGIAGCVSGSVIKGCFNTGTILNEVNSVSRAGGIVAEVKENSTINDCYNKGVVSAAGIPPIYMSHLEAYSGGIAGDMSDSSINNCYNIGIVSARAPFSCAGGIVGTMVGTISNCYSIGAVSANPIYYYQEAQAGGIAGYISAGSIDNCYNAGAISASYDSQLASYSHIGGIAGHMQEVCSISNCYNIGRVYIEGEGEDTHTGGILGYARKSSDIQSCYYLNDTQVGIGSGSGETIACSRAEMTQQKTFRNFDFESVWTMKGNPDYPFPEFVKMEMDLSFNTIMKFPDAVFRKYLLDNFDTDGDWCLSNHEFEAVTEIDVTNTSYAVEDITSLEGIQYFSNLKTLKCGGNAITSLDVGENSALTYLDCSSNRLTNLNVSKNSALTHLDCSFNQLTNLDIGACAALTWLDCGSNKLNGLDVRKNTALVWLNCGTDWMDIYSDKNHITNLDVSNNSKLASLNCECVGLESLDVSKNPALTYLNCSFNQLTSLDVSRNTALTELACDLNQFTSLDLSQNIHLGEGVHTPQIGYSIYSILVDEDRTADLSVLPGNFDGSKVSNLVGGTLKGNVLTVDAGVTEVTYTYDTGSDYPLNVTMEVIVAENPNGDVILRVYNPGNGKHHYTNGTQEANVLVAGGWEYEGFAWIAPEEGTPIYRVYNPGNGNHLYTMDAAERDALVAGGWTYEGILCYSAGTDGVPLYRVLNPYVTLNPHHYTDSWEECEFLKANGWIVEGISWYGLSK